MVASNVSLNRFWHV